MEKIIEIDLKNQNDLTEKYNKNSLSKEMIEYLVKQTILIEKNEKIKIIINKKCDTDVETTKLVKQGLQEEFDKNLLEHHKNNIKQIIFLILGIIFIFLSTLIKEGVIWKEILLISGWVPIWEMIELELFSDVAGRRKRRIIKKLLQSEIIERNLKKDKEFIKNS